MTTPILLLLETTDPPTLIHFHPAFPLITQRSDQFVDLPFECFGATFDTILHCLHYARFMALDQAYADLFTVQGAMAFLSTYERIQTATFGFVANMPPLEKLKFMGQQQSFFTFKEAIVTASARAHMQETEARFSTKLPAILREALVARYSRFTGTLPHPVCFESKVYPRIAEILSEILAHKLVPKHITSEPEKAAYKLCAMLSKRKVATSPPPVMFAAMPRRHSQGEDGSADKDEVSAETKLSADDAWRLLWSNSQKANVKERVQTLFKFVFPRFKPSLALKAFGPAWLI